MWTLFNRRKGAEGDSPAATSASAAVAADISQLPSKIPVEARPIDDTKVTSHPLSLHSHPLAAPAHQQATRSSAPVLATAI